MDLSKLFETQRKLDQYIIEKKNLQGRNLLPMKVLALQVELGELANCWRGFKFWSEDQKPRVEPNRWCEYCSERIIYDESRNPLLEEYVDCLHFILSIGLECKFDDGKFYTSHKETVMDQLLRLFEKVGDFSAFPTKGNYECIFNYFLGLGEMLGFTWNQVEQAYLEKNRVNYQRQESGY